ncbi:MAG: hypothetical protein ACYTFI_22080 [Planctomycetota bacterium]
MPQRASAKERDPWAPDDSLLGERARRHALSRRPGTPPCGNLAVQVPAGFVLAYRGSSAKAAEADRKALAPLSEMLRVEIELVECRRWTCGLAERASGRGLEVTLGGRSVGTRDFLQAGRKVNILVTPPAGSVFEITGRIVWVDAPDRPGGAMRAQILVDTSDARTLGQWERIVDRARRR